MEIIDNVNISYYLTYLRNCQHIKYLFNKRWRKQNIWNGWC